MSAPTADQIAEAVTARVQGVMDAAVEQVARAAAVRRAERGIDCSSFQQGNSVANELVVTVPASSNVWICEGIVVVLAAGVTGKVQLGDIVLPLQAVDGTNTFEHLRLPVAPQRPMRVFDLSAAITPVTFWVFGQEAPTATAGS